MKKILISVLVAALAVSMMGSNYIKAESNENNLHETDASIMFKGGSLDLIQVSSELNFGEITINNEKMSPKLIEGSEFSVLVSDTRGTGDGWSISGQLLSFMSQGTESLPGTSLHFSEGEKKSDSTVSNKPSLAKGTLMSKEDAKKIIEAKARQDTETFAESEGLGKWKITWNADMVNLEIPAAISSKGKHEAQVLWTITNGEI